MGPCVSSDVKELRKPCLDVGDVETASLMLLNSYGNPALVGTFGDIMTGLPLGEGWRVNQIREDEGSVLDRTGAVFSFSMGG